MARDYDDEDDELDNLLISSVEDFEKEEKTSEENPFEDIYELQFPTKKKRAKYYQSLKDIKEPIQELNKEHPSKDELDRIFIEDANQ